MKSYLGEDWASVLNGIRAYLGTDISLLNTTNELLLENEGKQLRPMLSLLMARACNGGRVNDSSIKFAVASELLHNATLLHDDVADKADERRGHPTVRSLMGPDVSVLVGDFWLVRAINAILDAKIGQNKAIALFAKTLADLAEGEMLQLQKASSGDTDFDAYLDIIYRKTGSLFEAAMLTAVISVGASPEQEEAARAYSKNLGYAFQMRDDILDYMPAATIGKPTGVDIIEHKITLPLLMALENVTEKEQLEVRNRFKDCTEATKNDIIAFVERNGGIDKAQKVLERYSGKAVKSLAVLPDSRDKLLLCEMAEHLARRTF